MKTSIERLFGTRIGAVGVIGNCVAGALNPNTYPLSREDMSSDPVFS